jgi:hypothetical protein
MEANTQKYIYGSRESKLEKFDIITIDTFDELMVAKKRFISEPYIFRGVNNWRYKMYTSFQRKMILEKLLYAEVFESYRKEYYSIIIGAIKCIHHFREK